MVECTLECLLGLLDLVSFLFSVILYPGCLLVIISCFDVVIYSFLGMNAEIRRQEKIDMAEERDFRRGELPGKFTAKMLYRWDDRKFEEEYLKKLERNWRR